MNYLTNFFLAVDAAASDSSGPSTLMQFVPFILIFALMYFVLIRPQMKAKKDQERLIAALKSGDRVTMSSGILGTVTNVKDKDVIVVRIADNVKIEVLKSSVTAITSDEVKLEAK